MKISCLQENLYRGLQIVSHCVGKENNLPILSSILLKTEKGIFSLHATNLELGVHCTVRAKVEQEGMCAVDARIFTEFINLLPKEKISLILSSDGILSIQCENYSTKIKTLSPDDFPLISPSDVVKTFSCSRDDFGNALSKTVFAIQPQEARSELSGLFLFYSSSKKTITCVGTDTYRLAEKDIPITPLQEEEKQIIIPLKILQEYARMSQYIEQNEITIALNENQIIIYTDTIELFSKLIQGTYPDYKQIIPKNHTTRAHLNVINFLKAVKASSIFSHKDIYDVVLHFTEQGGKGILKISSQNTIVGENVVTLEVEMSGEEQRITLNHRFIIDGVTTIKGDEIIISIVDAASPVVITSPQEKNYLQLLMPIEQS